MSKVKMIPCIYAGDLPEEVEEELREWNKELCYHGDSGSVFRVDGDDKERLHLFFNWMITQGAWTEQQAKLLSYTQYQMTFGRKSSEPDYYEYFNDYFQFLKDNNLEDRLEVAMTGT